MLKKMVGRAKDFFNKHDEKTKLILGKQLCWSQRNVNPSSIEEVGFSIFSQWDEDGIIQYLISQIPIDNKFFIEFGVENYQESNTRFLMMNNNWSGIVIDGSQDKIKEIKKSYYYWKYDLRAIHKFITKENINELLYTNIKEFKVSRNIGLLSIDLDGNDYWVLEAITSINPHIIICEYNSLFGTSIPVSIPYKQDFRRDKYHYSNLYFGANLKAFEYLLKDRGYVYVGSSCNKINAFFVKKKLVESYIPEFVQDSDKNFKMTKVRESRDEFGKLNFKRGKNRVKELKNMPLVNIKSGEIIKVDKLPEY